MTRIPKLLARVVLVGVLAAGVSVATPRVAAAQTAQEEVPKAKQTTLGLYVTAREAYDLWKADPEAVKVLDVRTNEEFLYVGHPAMAFNVPAFTQSWVWDAAAGHFPMVPNPDFMAQVSQVVGPDDTILVTCRSGGRSALAVNALAGAGFTHVYNIVDGVEGDKVEDGDSPLFGQRAKNGWKNSGLPFTYDVTPDRVVVAPGP